MLIIKTFALSLDVFEIAGIRRRALPCYSPYNILSTAINLK
jgi:hypothetical protein